MSFFIQSLFIAIPIFFILIVTEIFISIKKGIKVNRPVDMISSLSSGITNITKDGLKFGIVLISYSWLAEHFTLYKLEPIWAAVLVAFVVQDITGYWMHRLNHRVNVFWNRHIIHPRSEDFNLSCALRQAIAETVHFGAILMIPAAILGVPANIFAVLAPIHLFMQVWYHTRLIESMGWLEKIIVTPSHHRVHHAINSQYIDKNYGQILIIWDKMFGSFQPELDSVEPVYGILRPVKTWNPVIINYKHLWQLIQDAFYAERIWDKIRIWFMPTGWRPEDVALKYPIYTIEDPSRQEKYDTNISKSFIIWSFIQLNIAVTLMFHFFTVIPQQTMAMNYCYAALLMVHIFSFTSAMDRKRYSIGVEFLKMLMGFSLLYRQNFFWFGLDGVYIYSLMIYLIISVIMTWYFLQEYKMNSAHP